MENKLIYTSSARRDLDAVWDYIALELQNPSSADLTMTRILDAADRLQLFPQSGARLSSIIPWGDTLYQDERFLVSGKYLIFYHTLSNDIYIDRVLYGGRDYLRVLFGRVPEED